MPTCKHTQTGCYIYICTARHTQTGCYAPHSIHKQGLLATPGIVGVMYIYIYINNAVYLYIYMYLYILAPHAYTNRVLHATPAQSVRGYSNHPSLPKASEAVQSVRGLSMRLSLLKAHCVLGPDLYSLQVS